MAVGVHQRGRGIAGHRWLAHRQHVRARADRFEKGDKIVDIVVEVEKPLGQRHIARVAPVGDVDVVVWQHFLHSAT